MYEDAQERFYRKVLHELVGKKITRAGLTKNGAGFFIETDDRQLIMYSMMGDTYYPVEMKVRNKK